MRNLNILSIDLDYFNYVSQYGGRQATRLEVEAFFERLIRLNRLPTAVAWMQEHQYLYPWVLRLLKSRRAQKVNVVNVDEHHDFYSIGEMRDFKKSYVSCADFFGFMVFDGIMGCYEWVNNENQHSLIRGRREIVNECEVNPNLKVASWGYNNARNLQVWGRKRTWSALEGRVFDGVAIIESPAYTKKLATIRRAALKVLRAKGFDIRAHQCKTDFHYSRRRKVNMRPIFKAASMA